MKRLFISFIMAVAMIAAQPTQAATSSYTAHGDTATIIDGTDTVVITSKVAGLVEKIAQSNILEHLDDTIVDNNKDYDYNYEEQASNRDETFISVNAIWSGVARKIVVYTIVATVLIIFFVLFFRHANRRRKYKVLEKAIENNYPLPEGIFSDKGNKTVYVQQPAYGPAQPAQAPNATQSTVEGTPVPPPYRSYDNLGATADKGATKQHFNPMNEQFNWHALRGVGATAAGLGGIVFGLATGAEPLIGIFCIPLFIGGFKMFASYMDQRNAILAARSYYNANANANGNVNANANANNANVNANNGSVPGASTPVPPQQPTSETTTPPEL